MRNPPCEPADRKVRVELLAIEEEQEKRERDAKGGVGEVGERGSRRSSDEFSLATLEDASERISVWDGENNFASLYLRPEFSSEFNIWVRREESS
tara:strand:+ start:359 stop:643 length:285 start_codon:yes stop_codon:yes gene_type:complete